MLSNKQLKTLESILEDPEIRKKAILKKFIWVNTVDPKYKEGDCFTITDRSYYIFGRPAVNIKMKVIHPEAIMSEMKYRYQLEAVIHCNGTTKTLKFWETEDKLVTRAEDNDNIIDGDLNEPLEAFGAFI